MFATVAVLLMSWAPARAAEGVGRLSRDPSPSGQSEEGFRQAAMLDISEPALRALQEACLAGGFTAAEFSRLLGLMTRAKLTGLPHQELRKKLEEGLAKGAMPERIQEALQNKARTLRSAKELVDQLLVQGWAARDYTMAVALVADALEAGARPAQVLQAVRHDRPSGGGIPDVRVAFQQPSK